MIVMLVRCATHARIENRLSVFLRFAAYAYITKSGGKPINTSILGVTPGVIALCLISSF